MSVSPSIFQKPCPACASGVSIGAERCHCGHIFESSTKGLSPQEAALRDEELYEAYLAARAQQAKQAAVAATRALMEAPGNTELVAAAELATEVANAVASDHAAQCAKISALRRALPVAIAQAQPVTRPATVEVRPSAAPPQVTVAEVRPAPTTGANPADSPSRATAPVWHAATSAQKAVGALVALKSAKAREAAARARQAPAAARPAAAPAEAAPNNVPPQAFRQDQSTKAEKIMVARQAIDAKDCPNCTASVPLNAGRCHCGFTFMTNSSDLPSLTLCTGDFTALRDSLKLNLR